LPINRNLNLLVFKLSNHQYISAFTLYKIPNKGRPKKLLKKLQ
jgi:hypothetical protein